MDAITREKQYLLDARAYAATLSDLNLAVPADVSSFYTVTVTVSAGLPPLATLSAIPIAGKGQESDGTLSIATDGTKSPTDQWCHGWADRKRLGAGTMVSVRLAPGGPLLTQNHHQPTP